MRGESPSPRPSPREERLSDSHILNAERGAILDALEVVEVAGAITPVPGGVGQMTVACLLVNTLRAACGIHGLAKPSV